MKKKVLAISLVVAILAIAIVGGSLAWFTDSDEATNVFTIGSVEIVQNEDFVQESTLIPIVPNDTETPVDDANFVKKVATVSNVGKNPAYMQTFVAIPAALDAEEELDAGLLHVYYNGDTAATGWKAIDGNQILPGVQPIAYNLDIDGIEYNIYKFRNELEIAPGQTTAPVIEGVYIDKATDLEVIRDDAGNVTVAHFIWDGEMITDFNAVDKLNVYVVTQAVQSEGFASADAALDSAYDNTHPWSN